MLLLNYVSKYISSLVLLFWHLLHIIYYGGTRDRDSSANAMQLFLILVELNGFSCMYCCAFYFKYTLLILLVYCSFFSMLYQYNSFTDNSSEKYTLSDTGLHTLYNHVIRKTTIVLQSRRVWLRETVATGSNEGYRHGF